MSESKTEPVAKPHPRLPKANSWSPSTTDPKDAVWSQRKKLSLRRNRTFTCHDIEELEACFELGFEIDSPDTDPRLSKVFPALKFYQTVTTSSPSKFFDVDDPEEMKVRLRQWAKAVACNVRHLSSTPTQINDDEAVAADT